MSLSLPAIFSLIIIIYHFIVVGNIPAWFGLFIPGQIHSAISLSCAGLIIFFTTRGFSSNQDKLEVEKKGEVWTFKSVPIYDYFFIAALLLGNGYVILFNENLDLYAMYGFLDIKGMVLGALLGIAVLEAVRRTAGITLVLVIAFFIVITVYQRYLPGVLYGVGATMDRLLYAAYAGESGYFGQPLQIATSIILVYLMFGAVMQVIGAGQWSIDLAMALTGRSKGGAAKGAAMASAMFGSISGSPSSNVATTGIFTIPLMKSIGYKPAFAGAVESVASTGGQILPPVMGAIAFVMADWIGVDYVDVVVAATLPAILYYLVLFASVHFQAYKDDVRLLSSAEIPKLKPLLIRGIHYLIPIFALIFFLFGKSYPPELAGIYATGIAILSSFLTRDSSLWMTWKNFVNACHQTVGRWVAIVVITASVGLMIGSLEFSGVGIKLSTFAVNLSDGNLIFALALVGIASLFIGMGLDAIPAYLTLATLLAPALVVLGVSEIAAHLFVVYWGLASFFTPPMCIAVYVALTISGAKLWETGWEAVKLGIAAFIIPFAFVLDEGLLMRGSFQHIALTFTTAAIGSVALAAAIRGYAMTQLGIFSRIVLGMAAFLLITPGESLIGLGLVIAVIVSNQIITRNKARQVK
jgi:TRAP transporter 4TM/12TM fusion protein